MPAANPNYLPPGSVVALRDLGPALERTFAGGGVRQAVGSFIEAAALETEAEVYQAEALAQAYVQGLGEYRAAFQEVEDTIGPTRVNAIMRQARGRTAATLAEVASDLTGETWQAALGIGGALGVNASALGSYPGLISQALPYAQAAYALYSWIGAIRREMEWEPDFEALAYQRLRVYTLGNAINLALSNRLGMDEDWSEGSAFQNVRDGVGDYLTEYYQPVFEQSVNEYLACEDAWEDEYHWPWSSSGCYRRMTREVDEDAFADSVARVVSALLGGEAMAREENTPTGRRTPTPEDAARAARRRADAASARRAEARRGSPTITNARLRDAVVDAITLRTHSGHMTIQPGDLRNALAPGNVFGRVVPPQRVRARRGDDWTRTVTTMFGLGVDPDFDQIPTEPGDVINVAVRTRLAAPNLVIDLFKASRYGGGWRSAGRALIRARPPQGASAYPASHYDWRSYETGPRPGGGEAGSEFANEAPPEAARRQAEEYAVGPVDVAPSSVRDAEVGRPNWQQGIQFGRERGGGYRRGGFTGDQWRPQGVGSWTPPVAAQPEPGPPGEDPFVHEGEPYEFEDTPIDVKTGTGTENGTENGKGLMALVLGAVLALNS